MSENIKPIALNKTLQQTNALLGMMVEQKITETANWNDIGEMVRHGLAERVFSIGDQLVTTWTDTATNTEYTIPLDIVHFGDVILADGEIVPGMFLQWHYSTPFGVQFDQNEAFYYCDTALTAGTYNFTMGNSWGSNVVSGKTYQFTLTQDVPVGGQLQLGTASNEMSDLPDKAPSLWRVRVYASASTIIPTEILELTEGSEGTSLGTLSSSTKFSTSGMNNMQRAGYGYNRWSQSGVRQFLNSNKDKTAWWSAQNVFDRAPDQLQTKNGFLTGFKDEFLAQIKPIKVLTALNTVSDSTIGEFEYTYDTFFLPSKTNEFLNAQYTEGDTWEYWKRLNNGVKPADYTSGAAPITYSVANHTSAQYVWLRSASRGNSCHPWYVYSSGSVSNTNARYSSSLAPACVIC